MSLYNCLADQKIYGVLDLIPAYTSLTLVYDLALLTQKYPGGTVYERMKKLLQDAVANNKTGTHIIPRKVEMPVCYDNSLAPDLLSLAELHQLTVEEVIQLHTAPTYHVYMIGFLPGFAYMGSVDKKIITPRRATPRTKVPAGSVGIAGEQTGIYPLDSPGGWQLIGQTPLELFDTTKEDPCLLQPGDQVQFYPVSLTEFQKLKQV